MRMNRVGLLAALFAGITGCKSDDLSPTSPNIPPLAFVRYINAVPDTFNLTVRFIDQLSYSPMTFTNVPYRGLGTGNYQGARAGVRRFRVFTYDPALGSNTNGLAAGTVQLADTTFDFVAGQYYTILHSGYARAGQLPQQQVFILNDDLGPVDAANVRVRLINAGIQLGAMDGYYPATATSPVAGAPAVAGLAYATASAYASRAPAAFAGQFTNAGVTTVVAATNAPAGLAANGIDPATAGALRGGSVLTGILFRPSVAGSPAAASATASVVWFRDRQPPLPATP